MIIGEFNTLLTSWIYYPDRKSTRETVALSSTLDQMALTDINITFYLKTVETSEYFFFFLGVYVMLSRKDYILGYKTNLNKFKKIKILSSYLTTTVWN